MEYDKIFNELFDADGLRKGYYKLDGQGKYVLDTNPTLGEAVVNGLMLTELRTHLEESRKAVHAGLKSPLFYYMELRQFDLPTLAKSAGIASFRVKRHLRPEIFAKLKPSVLERYAKVLMVTQQELKTVPDI
jgi:hypothetical protein